MVRLPDFVVVPIAALSIGLTKWGIKWQNDRYVRSAKNVDDIEILSEDKAIKKANRRIGEQMISLDLLLKHMQWANKGNI